MTFQLFLTELIFIYILWHYFFFFYRERSDILVSAKLTVSKSSRMQYSQKGSDKLFSLPAQLTIFISLQIRLMPPDDIRNICDESESWDFHEGNHEDHSLLVSDAVYFVRWHERLEGICCIRLPPWRNNAAKYFETLVPNHQTRAVKLGVRSPHVAR
jgi:hypothetical protein